MLLLMLELLLLPLFALPRTWLPTYYYFIFFSFLIRRAINAVTVIPLTTLLIPQPIIAVMVAGCVAWSSFANIMIV